VSGQKARTVYGSAVRGASRATVAGLVLWLGIGSIAWPQDAQIQPNYREADIRQVIEAVGEVTGRNFLVDPRVRGQITLLSFTPMTPDAFYQAFLATLEVNGFVALDSDGVVKIVPDANARQMAGAGAAGEGDEMVTQVVVLENIGAAQLVPILRVLIPTYGHLAAHPTSNSLIIVDRAANMTRILNIIRRMDRAGTQGVEVIPLENAAANDVVQMLSTLNQNAQAIGGAPPVQVIADDRTNSVLLSGPEAARLQYRMLVAHLDTPSEQGGDTLVHYLNYADAEDLAMKLQAQFGAAGAAPAAPGPEGGAAGPAAGPVTIWADPGTNALVINAPERIRQDMMAVIRMIDIPRLQVQVDAIIVEVSETKAAQLGVTWLVDGSGDDEAVGLTNFNQVTGGILQLGTAISGDTPNPTAIAQGLTLGVGSISETGTSWAAILTALRSDAGTNIVSTPTIVTLDNEEAEIRVGQEVPFLTGQFTNTGAAAGSVNPFQTIQREEVGTSLKITPQINEGSGVKLVIEQETSSLDLSTQAADLVTNSRVITTSVFVDDGNILVLGGLIDDQLRQGEQRVPGLGRIPGLGWLFRARRTDRERSNLMVFIRPTILRDKEDAAFQTSSKYNDVREIQRRLAEDRIRLMREERHPELPPLPDEIPPVDPNAPAPTDGGDTQ
jgi:general secretion pathway protein D